MTDRRRGWRLGTAVIAAVVMLAGCTTTTLNPTTSGAGSTASGPVSATATATPTASGTEQPSGTTAGTPASESTAASESSLAPDTRSSEAETSSEAVSSVPTSTAPTAFTPAVDADAVDGPCPYLTKDQVQADTGQRTGATRVRPADPQPVCEFVRSDGDFLATVRVLKLDSEAVAVGAVDFYVPRDASNPETRPAGWSGGSLATDDGSRYAVSKGDYAVMAETNQKQSVYARLLVLHAIENLGL